MRKWNLSLFRNGPVYAVIFVNDSAIVNQTDGHWTMTGSVKIIIMKPLHSLDTATIPTFDLDTSCAAVMTCVSSSMVCAKTTQSLIARAVVSLLRISCFQQFFRFRLLSDNLPLFVFPAKSSIRCPTREDQVVQHSPKNMGTFKRKSDFLIVENRDKAISSNEKLNAANDPQFSLLVEFWETTEASRERSAEQVFDD